MKSVHDIKTIAKRLATYSQDRDGKVDIHAVGSITNMIEQEKLAKIGIRVETIQKVLLMKEYLKLIRNLVIEDSVIVTSAVPLDTKQKDTITKAFSAISIQFRQSSDIIGGLKIQSGWDITDNTIQNTLHTLPF